MIGAPNFICVACEREVENRWWSPRNRDRALPPLCPCCEGHYSERIGKPNHGSLADRRNAMRLVAIAEALHTAACAKQWGVRYASA